MAGAVFFLDEEQAFVHSGVAHLKSALDAAHTLGVGLVLGGGDGGSSGPQPEPGALGCAISGYCSVGKVQTFRGDIATNAALAQMLQAVSYRKEVRCGVWLLPAAHWLAARQLGQERGSAHPPNLSCRPRPPPLQIIFVLLGGGSFVNNQMAVNQALSLEALGALRCACCPCCDSHAAHACRACSLCLAVLRCAAVLPPPPLPPGPPPACCRHQ